VTIRDERPWISSYADGVPEDLPEQTGTLVDLIAESVRDYPKATALEFFAAETSYAELGEQIERAAEGLRRQGVSKGDTVAIVLPNCPQHVVAFYAALRLGAIVVEHNPLYTPRELRHQFEDHGAKTVIAWDKTVATLQDFPKDVRPDTIVAVDLPSAMGRKTRILLNLPIKKARESKAALTVPTKGALAWKDLLGHGRLSTEHEGPAHEDIALIQYTSGTTGSPKGAVLTHRNLVANAAQSRAWVPTITRGDCTVYAVLPLFHAYGLTLCLTFAMSMGARLVLFPRFDPDLVLPVVKKHPPTFFPAVPPIYDRLTKAAKAKGVSLEGIEIAISGAMPLYSAIVDPWEEETKGFLVEGYGLSETSPVISANPVAGNRRAGTIGLPLPGTEVRIVDPEDPTVVRSLGDEGELVVRGPQVFAGYWRKPDESAAVFADGWFRTGDIATIDDDGFIRIVDRIKELIITGGFNVAPSEVEDVLRRFPGVADAAIVGLPDEHSGEQVVAAVVVEDGAEVDPEALRAFARSEMAAYKAPRRIEFVDELPRSLIGKVLRRQVRERLQA